MAYVGGNTINSKHQPGSAIKPVLVFAPAIENGTISPATKIYDEEINIAGYSPENADKTFHGYVSAREALKYSYNIPAVKLLNELGISNAQSFAKKLGIEFSNQDNNLAIALGGFTNGITLNSLCDAYTCFANNGEFKKSQFISKIVKNKTEIYRDSKPRKSVMKDSTAYLITDILKDASKTGTAKRLKDLNFELQAKLEQLVQALAQKILTLIMFLTHLLTPFYLILVEEKCLKKLMVQLILACFQGCL